MPINKKIMALALTLAILLCSTDTRNINAQSNRIEVGAFYYVWYEGKQNSNCVDTPVIGWSNYNSNSSTVIFQHLSWATQAGIDFFIISWWGQGSFTDLALTAVFKTAQSSNTTMKFAIMIEPFGDNYNYESMYDYIYDHFVTFYASFWQQVNGKPLLCFFNDPILTPNGVFPLDDRFSMRIVGDMDYVDWVYTSPVEGAKHSIETPSVEKDNAITVMPRYDDRVTRTPSYIIDVDYSKDIYHTQWSKVLSEAKLGHVNYVLIVSWNEYAERTQIEPMIDNVTANGGKTSATNSTYLLDATSNFITQLRLVNPTSGFPLIEILVIVTISMSIFAWVVIRKRHCYLKLLSAKV